MKQSVEVTKANLPKKMSKEKTIMKTTKNPFNKQRTMGSNEMDGDNYEKTITESLWGYKVFKETQEYNEIPLLKPVTEATFKKICQENNKETLKLQNTKINAAKLKKYLSKRYNARLATKMTSIYDWMNLGEYKQFYFLFDKDILGRKRDETAAPNEIKISLNYNYMEHLQ